MKKHIRINNPCSEKWENMQDSFQGRFCEKCSKCVVDFTDKTDQEIQNIIKNADGQEICGRISFPFSKIAAGLVLITNLTFVRAQSNNDFKTATEQKVTNITKVSGSVILKESQKVISNAEVFFITKSKLLKTTTNEDGNFSLDVPDDLIEKENVLYFNFDKLNEINRKEKKGRDTIRAYDYENQTIVFSQKEKIENKKIQIDYIGHEIGAVVISLYPPPDYYYFNGKSIGKRKFEKLKNGNPQYQYFRFEKKEAEIIAKKSYLNILYLLYSN